MQLVRVVKGPHVGANTNTEVEHFLANNVVVGYLYAGITATVLVVDHVNGAEAEILVRAGNGVVRDGAARGAKYDDATVSRSSDLHGGQSTFIPEIMALQLRT